VPDADIARKGGEVVPLRRTIDDDDVRLEPPRLEALTADEEAEIADLLAALFAVALSRRMERAPLREAA
jgi:hypothetical protein